MADQRLGKSQETACLDGDKNKIINCDRRMEQPSPEPVKLDATFISIVSGGGDMYELAELVATEVASGLEVPDNNNNSGLQSGNDNDVRIDIDPSTEPTNVPTIVSPVHLPRALWTVALLTLIMDIGTILYKPPRGVIFNHNRLAYYLTLAGIFVAGVAEALTAFWISGSRDAYGRCFSFGRVVLCASIGPFIIIIVIGGFAFTDGS